MPEARILICRMSPKMHVRCKEDYRMLPDPFFPGLLFLFLELAAEIRCCALQEASMTH